MLSLLVLASVSAASVEEKPRTVSAQPVRAAVRIIRGAEIRLGQEAHFEERVKRKAEVRERDGSIRSASLIEFY